ncbi:hypothetical protein D3C75_148610 [compost metagenome]
MRERRIPVKDAERLAALKLSEENIRYPDFNRMWESIERDRLLTEQTNSVMSEGPDVKWSWSGPENNETQRKGRSWGKMTIAASVAVLLIAAPVYAAVHGDWGHLLTSKPGIQSALDRNLGQKLGQTMTMNGIKLNLETAFVDENRTVILFTLDVGKRAETDFWKFGDLYIESEQGNKLGEGYNYLQWDEQKGRYNGYFETEWSPDTETAKVRLVAEGLTAYSLGEQDISLNPSSNASQSFKVGKEGIKEIAVQTFRMDSGKTLFASTVLFDRPEAKEWTYPQIALFHGEEAVQQLSGSMFGTPDENGNYTTQQYYQTSDATAAGASFKLQYWQLEQSVSKPWNFDLTLSKKQMEFGTTITPLNVPLEPGNNALKVEKMVVTPTQIRVGIRSSKLPYNFPYQKYRLEIDGRTLEAAPYYSAVQGDLGYRGYQFEMPSDLIIKKDSHIVLVGVFKVNYVEDQQTAFRLTGIDEEKRHLNAVIGGYPVTWTYYMKGSDLYVESSSDNTLFGGVNQTFIMQDGQRLLGKVQKYGIDGQKDNHAIDVYKGFKGSEAEVHMFFYTTNEPEKETRVTLQ